MSLRFSALLVSILHLTCASAASDWELKVADREADIRILSRVNERGYQEFKGVMKIRSTLGAFVALFKDVEHMPGWAYRISRAEKLAEVSETETYAYTVNSLPPPLYDRDAVVHTTISQDRATLKMIFRNTGVPDYVPKSDRYVRMPVVESSWTFTPLGAGMVEVVFEGYGDPGGSLSSALLAWYVRLTLSEAPYHTMLQMKSVVSRPEYQAARYSFIREAAP